VRANQYTALIDACALAGALTRNMILSLAEAGFFRPRWSQDILSETERAICDILRKRGEATPATVAARQRAAITRAFPEASVEGYETLVAGLDLPDQNDRHVLAAAIQARAAVIVTTNTKDFPSSYLATLNLQASTPDRFLADVIDLYTPDAVAALRTMRERFKRPELDAESLLRRMESVGLTDTVNLLISETKSL
jgi:predicted nucleic acid-binding protein